MKRVGSPAALVAGCALLLVTNAAILSAAASNRWGGPRQKLELTERELAMPAFREEENTGLLLSRVLGDDAPAVVARAAFRNHYALPRADPPWLDRAKLRELGFRRDIDPSDPAAGEICDAELSRRVLIVLEFDGEAWKSWLAAQEERLNELRLRVERGETDRKRLQDAEIVLALDRAMRSRLFPVDAGTDAESLLRRYPDRGRYLVARGVVSLALVREQDRAPRLRSIVELLPNEVHVPTSLRPHFKRFLPEETPQQVFDREHKEPEGTWPSPTPPRYRAALAFGRRLQPWIASVASLDAPAGR